MFSVLSCFFIFEIRTNVSIFSRFLPIQIGEKGFGTLCLYLEGLKGAGREASELDMKVDTSKKYTSRCCLPCINSHSSYRYTSHIQVDIMYRVYLLLSVYTKHEVVVMYSRVSFTGIRIYMKYIQADISRLHTSEYIFIHLRRVEISWLVVDLRPILQVLRLFCSVLLCR